MRGNEQSKGLWLGFAAYAIWGFFPLYWPLLKPAGAWEILADRMVWSAVAALVLLALGRLRRPDALAWIRPLLRQRRRLALIGLAAVVISVNWGMYIWGVNSGHVVETSLGYFINPLVTITFGVLLLRERLRPAQWVAVGTGAAAVVVLTLGYGRLPWIALTLAFSFATYGLLKKKVALGGLEGFAVETAFLFPPALGYLVWLSATGRSTFTGHGPGHAALLALCGLVTAVPLVAFGAAAVRVPLTTMGLLQYLAPVFQFLLGVAVFHEHMPTERWVGFGLVWVALLMLTVDGLRAARRRTDDPSTERARPLDTSTARGM
ncbi:chloramphenicol-sensitive protein RarD [Streptacidiphilus sp. MAP12-33]|uniref:EamA family transporter RarD n=1 Tax=Streptacidiphilus sp. MAP12-33 TaxID=3156266 RepID=UPI0035120A0A